jgi:DNA-binding protein HU-beta
MAGLQELVDRVASETQLSKAQSRSAVDALLAGIADALARGEEVRLPGFGVFHVRQRAARMGRNVRTGEPLTIAASQRPSFSPGSRLVAQMKGLEGKPITRPK